MEDPLDFLLTMAPPPARTRAVILGELLAARTLANQMIGCVRTRKGAEPLQEQRAQARLVDGLAEALRSFDRAARSPLEQFKDDVKTAEAELDRFLAMRARKDEDGGRLVCMIQNSRAQAQHQLTQAQADLAAFLAAEATQPAAPQPAAPLVAAAPVRSPAALARLAAHMEADRLTRLKSK